MMAKQWSVTVNQRKCREQELCAKRYEEQEGSLLLPSEGNM